MKIYAMRSTTVCAQHHDTMTMNADRFTEDRIGQANLKLEANRESMMTALSGAVEVRILLFCQS